MEYKPILPILLGVLLVSSHHISWNSAWAKEQNQVPSWTKKISDFWNEDKISNQESVNAFQYLIDKKIIVMNGLEFDKNESYDKKIKQTIMITSFLWNEPEEPLGFKSKYNSNHNNIPYEIYAEPDPSWAPHTKDALLKATSYWENRTGSKFDYTSNPNNATIFINWLQEPGYIESGHTVGKTIEVALGDSRCDNTWHSYDNNFVSATITHELGHVLGFGHSQNMADIMYPVIPDAKYAPIKQEFTLGANGAVFVHVCTFNQKASFHYSVVSNDTKIPIKILFVPSEIQYAHFLNGQKFDSNNETGCIGRGTNTYDNLCPNVSNFGGMIIQVSNKTQSHQKITLTLEEE